MDHPEARDYDKLIKQQTTLARFGEMALCANDLGEVLTEACRLVAEALGTDLAKVMELQEGGKTLLVRAGVGWGPDVVGKIVVEATANSSEGRALSTGEPLISPDIDTETRFAYPRFLTDNGVRAVASVIIGGHMKPPFGILQIDSRVPREFTGGDTDFLRSYANLLGGAVDRHKAEAAMRDSNEALEARVGQRTSELTQANVSLKAQAEARARVEDTLRQSQKMEALGQLTGGLAHDFNNLLTAMSGSLQLIEARVSEGRVGELDRYIKSAMVSVDRAAAITQRLLAFSRHQAIDAKPIDVNRLIAGMEELFARTIGASIQVSLRLYPRLWSPRCDANQFENVLLNLVLNARDAMPDGGSLKIETANIVLPARDGVHRELSDKLPPGDYMVLTVADSGVGMTQDVLNRALDPFFTTKPIGKGTGLGLSMARGFAEQSGGYIYLASNGDRGVVATICLPRHVADAELSGGELVGAQSDAG